MSRSNNRGPKITCKTCNVKFNRLDWMQNTDCDNPNCRCPAVKAAREMTTNVIENAQNAARETASTNIKTEWSPIPPNRDTNVGQYYVEVPEVMSILVTPVKRGK